MENINGMLITGRLARVIENYRRIEACHQVVEGFEHFSTEAIVYARLEWSKFLRDTYDEKDRVKYLWEKCFEYDSPGVLIPIVDVIVDESYGITMKITHHTEKVDKDDLPF